MSAGKLDAHVLKRHEDYMAAHNNPDFPKSLMEMVHDDVKFTDYNAGKDPMDKAGFEGMFQHVKSVTSEFSCESVSVHGDRDFTAIEWIARFRYDKPSPMIPGVEAKGQKVTLYGGSFMDWKDDKVIKSNDYSKFFFEES